DNMCKAYLASFNDKYTVYYTKEEFTDLQETQNGSFVGIGIVGAKDEDGNILVIDPMDNAPAQKAGIKAGDCIVSIDGQSVLGETLAESTARLKGEAGTKVTLGVRREGVAEEIQFEVTREVVDYETVDSMLLEDDIYYIQISQFIGTTAAHFRREYDKCLEAGAKGIIIDVRENPGGLMTSVLDVLDMLCPKDLLMYTEDKNGNRVDQYGKSDEEATIPMAVLVNGNSASAAEVFSGDLQDYGKAVIIGTQTFGKGIVQAIKSLGDGTGVKYTTSKYYTAKGQDIHGHGVTPDVVIEYVESDVPDEEYTYRDDNQVMKAIEVLKSQIQNINS
ncbi:MAG: S41 family peptidase, partial [Lachnospiraceae bacterium]